MSSCHVVCVVLVVSSRFDELPDLQNASSEETACPVTDVFKKVVAAKKSQLGEGEELPADLLSEAEFMLSAQRFNRIRFKDGKAWMVPRSSEGHDGGKPRALRGRQPRVPITEEGQEGSAARVAPERRRRPQGTPQEPKDLGLSPDVNDSTYIASLIYKRLCARGAVSIQYGLSVKSLLRFTSIDFKEARPDAEPASMRSLRVFKILLGQIPGIKRQWPRLPARGNRGKPRFTPELVVWMDDEDAIIEGIKKGLPDDLATMTIQPDVIENDKEIEGGTPQSVCVLNQDAWNTSVVGPTASEAVLAKFLSDNKDQAVWGFETEHRVGLHRRPAGKIAIIVLSDMHHTIIWDVHQGGIPDCLRAFFANEEIFKGGVRVGPKVQKLQKQFDVKPAKFVELSVIARGLDLITEEEKERISIRIMTHNVLNYAVRCRLFACTMYMDI
jgi:hypothetical protein